MTIQEYLEQVERKFYSMDRMSENNAYQKEKDFNITGCDIQPVVRIKIKFRKIK